MAEQVFQGQESEDHNEDGCRKWRLIETTLPSEAALRDELREWLLETTLAPLAALRGLIEVDELMDEEFMDKFMHKIHHRRAWPGLDEIIDKEFMAKIVDKILRLRSAEEEETHNVAAANGSSAADHAHVARVASIQRQGSLTVPRVRSLIQKTVNKGRRDLLCVGGPSAEAAAALPSPAQPQPTLGENTPEDFLARAGVAREDMTAPLPAPPAPVSPPPPLQPHHQQEMDQQDAQIRMSMTHGLSISGRHHPVPTQRYAAAATTTTGGAGDGAATGGHSLLGNFTGSSGVRADMELLHRRYRDTVVAQRRTDSDLEAGGGGAAPTQQPSEQEVDKMLKDFICQLYAASQPACALAYSALKDAPDHIKLIIFGGLGVINIVLFAGMLSRSSARRRVAFRLVSCSAVTLLTFSVASQLSGPAYIIAITAVVGVLLSLAIMLLRF